MTSPQRSASIWKLALSASALLVLSACERPAELDWSWAGNGPSRSGLVALGDGVIFGNEAGELVRLSASGAPVWRTLVGGEVASRPAVVGDTVVASTIGGEWVGVDFETGKEKWRLGGKPALTLPLASDDTRAYAVADDGSVMAISGANGGTVWKVLPPRGVSGALRLDAAPAVAEGRLIVGLGAAGLRALNPEDGETLWQKRMGEVVGFLAVGDRIYVLSAEGTMAALQASTGEVQWQQRLKVKPTGGPWLARGLLWVAAAGDVLAAVDPQDGTETWQTKLPAPLKGGVSDYRELVLVPTNGREGRLLGLRPGQSEPVIDVHVDSALRTEPRVIGDDVLVQASDGRVLAWEIKRTRR